MAKGTGSRLRVVLMVLATLAAGVVASGCKDEGVGDPCVPEDEYRADFSGYAEGEINVESRSFQCATRTCLVANFRGRVSCPYGGAAGECRTPDGELVGVAVAPQLVERRPAAAVYCSCRCSGEDPNDPYCECPSGFTCADGLLPDYDFGDKKKTGGYCIKDGSRVADAILLSQDECTDGECGNKDGNY